MNRIILRLIAFITISTSCLPGVYASEWSLDSVIKEGSSLVVKDQSADLIHLTLNNMPVDSQVTGVSGSALTFNGQNQHVSTDNAEALQSESVTISAWVNPSLRLSYPDTGEWVAAQADNFGLYLTSDRRVAFYVKNDGANGWSDVLSPADYYSFNQWIHIAGTYNSQNHVLKVYVNGEEAGSSPWGSGIGYSTGDGFSIGSMAGHNHFLGSIDEVNVFQTTYSPADIQKLADKSKSPGLTSTIPATTPVLTHTDNHLIKADQLDAKNLQTPSVTLSAWIYPKQRSTYPETGEWVASQADNFGLYLTADRRIAFYVKNRGTGWTDVFSPVNTVRFNQWQHIAGSFNAATNELKLYVDGKHIATSPWGSGIGYLTGDRFTIGSMNGARQFSGQINKVKAFQSVLTADRVKQLTAEGQMVAAIPPVKPTVPVTSAPTIPVTPTTSVTPAPTPTTPVDVSNNPDSPVIRISSSSQSILRRSVAGTVVGKITVEFKKQATLDSRKLNQRGTHSASPEFEINTDNQIVLKQGATLTDNQYQLEAIYVSDLGNSNILPITVNVVNDFKGKTIKVIALGDSITEGGSYSQENVIGNAVVPVDENGEPPYGQSYRSSIAKVQDASPHGVKIDFIGTKQADWGGDVEYDGWSGFTTADILNGAEGVQPMQRLKTAGLIPQADAVFITLGTNDAIAAGQGKQIDTQANLTQIIEELRASNPNLVFFLARLIPFDSDNTTIFDFGLADGYSDIITFKEALNATNEQIPDKNAVIDRVAGQLSTHHSPVVSVDMTSAFAGQQARLLSDGIHPNNVGERVMAEKWVEAIDPFFDGLEE